MAGACAVAAPVATGDGLYVMTVFGPRERMLEAGVEAIAAHLLSASQELVDTLLTSRRPRL